MFAANPHNIHEQRKKYALSLLISDINRLPQLEFSDNLKTLTELTKEICLQLQKIIPSSEITREHILVKNLKKSIKNIIKELNSPENAHWPWKDTLLMSLLLSEGSFLNGIAADENAPDNSSTQCLVM